MKTAITSTDFCLKRTAVQAAPEFLKYTFNSLMRFGCIFHQQETELSSNILFIVTKVSGSTYKYSKYQFTSLQYTVFSVAIFRLILLIFTILF